MNPQRYRKFKGVLARRQLDLTVLSEDVHKPHNISALLRTCDAVGIFELHVVNRLAAFPLYRAIARGTDKWVLVQAHPDIQVAIAALRSRGFGVYAAHLSETAVDYREIDYTQPTAILLGAERWGVSEGAAASVDGHLQVPMLGMGESLNVSVAAAVILFEAQRQRLVAGFYERQQLDEAIQAEILFEWAYPELAAHCREVQQPYPPLGPDGEILGELLG